MPDCGSIERALMTRLAPLARGVQRIADGELSKLGISHSAGWALTYLARLGAGARQGDLARALGITEASLVRTLHQLEAVGLVTREADPEDRRTNRLAMTPEGERLAAQIDARLATLRTVLLADLPSSDIETAIRVLDHLATRLSGWRGLP